MRKAKKTTRSAKSAETVNNFCRFAPFTVSRLPFLLEQPSQISRHVQQLELRFLAIVVDVEERHPLVTLVQPGAFDVAEVPSAFLKACLDHLEALLRELEFKASDLTA